ncbi:MAG: hypothetical protein ACJAYH_001071 [Celeribacter sp.]|jgi:hypothetical protein
MEDGSVVHKDFLKVGNPKKLIGILDGLLEPEQIELINEQQKLQAKAMFDLGVSHFRFANALNNTHWRQRVSRFYYGAYNGSKAIRYMVDGSHSTDSSDHKKIGELPTDFPDRATYSTRLKELRDDRNKCDYDHAARARDLFISQADAGVLTSDFLKTALVYLNERGLVLRSRI